MTSPQIVHALGVMRMWGFTYKTMLIWRKTTAGGRVRWGTGYVARTLHEPVLLGTIGKPKLTSAFPSLFDGLARGHSRKPESFYELVRKHTAGLRRADLFSRETRHGFESWGDESTKFDRVPNGRPCAAEPVLEERGVGEGGGVDRDDPCRSQSALR